MRSRGGYAPLNDMLEEMEAKGASTGLLREGQYIYCIIGTDEAGNFGPIGIGDRGDAVTTIAYKDLSAVVSSVPMTKYVVSSKTMLAHEKVVETVMRDYTVLPVRFYTVAPSAEDIRNLLRRRYFEFKKLLRELEHKVELGLKCLWRDMNAIFREIEKETKAAGARGAEIKPLPDDEAGKKPAEQVIKLALQEKKVRESELLLQPLKRMSSDFCLNRTYGDDMLMNAAFLIDKAREKAFDSEVEQLAARYKDRIEFKYVGPAPPYSFVNIVVEQ